MSASLQIDHDYTAEHLNLRVALYEKDMDQLARRIDREHSERSIEQKRECQLSHFCEIILDCAEKGIKVLPMHPRTDPEFIK
jgi:hypothetical protein